MKELSQPSEKAIIVRSRATSCEAHFAPFKNLMKAKQRMRRERELSLGQTRVALALNGSRRRQRIEDEGAETRARAS